MQFEIIPTKQFEDDLRYYLKKKKFNNVRLREMSLSYMLPAKWFGEKLNISLSLTGHNLLMFYKKAPFDPELTANTGTYYQGFDYFMPPSLRSFGFGVKVNF